MCTALTAGLDAAIRELSNGVGPGAAVVALGGYGRGEQCIWSDVDLMLLHRGGGTERLTTAVLYPLWDANLKVGHAVRTIDECRGAGRDDFETLTSLLSSRLVAGDADLFEELTATVAGMVRSRPLAPALTREERRRRAAEPFPVMAADLKEGRGALRTHQGFWWERRRAELIGLPSDQPDIAEREARAALLAVRNALHAAAGRAADRFVVDLREPAAVWLGSDVLDVAAALTSALHAGDALADRRWPDLHTERDPLVGFGRKVFGTIRTRFSTTEPTPAPAGSVLAVAVHAAGRKDGARFDSSEEVSIRAAGTTRWAESDRQAFLLLLSARARGRAIFSRLEELGWVGREFPEWVPVATAPQLAPFHEHPVGAHLWRTVDEMQDLVGERGEMASIADEVGSTEELLLAAFLHDIGKARGGNHEVVGADLATAFLRRAGFGPATVGVVADAVRFHLLLSQTATRRDIADPSVIDETAATVGDLRQLQVLYLLTIADLRATGSTMWTEWRADLLRTLYLRVAEALREGGAMRATPDITEIVEAGAGRLAGRLVEEHVAAMPPDYLDTTPPAEVAWHLDALTRLDGPCLVEADPTDPGRVLVAGTDRTGFLLAVTRAFTANGIEVMDARLRTRSDGIALDTFHVRTDRTGDAVSSEQWVRVADDLLATLTGVRDLRPALRDRILAYRRSTEDRRGIEVRTDNSGRHTAIEVRAPDRIGLLTDIVGALHDEELDVHYAKIDTMGTEARDLFYVHRPKAPIRNESELAGLRERLAVRLRSDADHGD